MQSQPNYVSRLFVFSLFSPSDHRGSQQENKAVKNMQDNFLKTQQLQRQSDGGMGERNDRPSEWNVICMILSLLNCRERCDRGHIRKPSIYTITVLLSVHAAVCRCELQGSSSKTHQETNNNWHIHLLRSIPFPSLKRTIRIHFRVPAHFIFQIPVYSQLKFQISNEGSTFFPSNNRVKKQISKSRNSSKKKFWSLTVTLDSSVSSAMFFFFYLFVVV